MQYFIKIIYNSPKNKAIKRDPSITHFELSRSFAEDV